MRFRTPQDVHKCQTALLLLLLQVAASIGTVDGRVHLHLLLVEINSVILRTLNGKRIQCLQALTHMYVHMYVYLPNILCLSTVQR